MCDGKNDYEDTVLKAIEKGFKSIGFSSHSHVVSNPRSKVKIEDIPKYQNIIYSLKEKYKDIIEVLCGIEFDFYSNDPLVGYEYVIGSVHYLEVDGKCFGFDGNDECAKKIIDTYFNSDGLAYVRKYYETVARLSEVQKVDIVAHFDIITKHKEKRELFDIQCRQYKSYALEALEHLAKTIGVFELNTGAIARNYRTTPYPDLFLLKALKEYGAKMVISSDCHDNNLLECQFEESTELLRSVGFKEIYTLQSGSFVGEKI